MITDDQVSAAVEYLRAKSGLAAKARAERLYLEDFTKHLESRLARDSGESSVSAREMIARASEDYLTHLQAVKIAVEEDEKYRHMMKAAETVIDVWRTESSNERALGKI